MSLIKRMRRQKAVWWARTTVDAYGRFSFAEPVEIDCRWDDCAKEYRDSQGELLVSSAVVYVDREMVIGDMLKKGEMDSDTLDDPRGFAGAYEIKQFEINPNLRATENLLTAYLS